MVFVIILLGKIVQLTRLFRVTTTLLSHKNYFKQNLPRLLTMRTTAGHFISCNLDMKGKFYMANLQYKKTLTTSLKVIGKINTSDMTVEVNGEVKKLSVLLSDLDGEDIEINVKTKEEMELDLPEDDSDEDE